MSPRISSAEAMVYPLSINPFRRRWQVASLLGEASLESGVGMTISGLPGRGVLVQSLRAIERYENERLQLVETLADAIFKALPEEQTARLRHDEAYRQEFSTIISDVVEKVLTDGAPTTEPQS